MSSKFARHYSAHEAQRCEYAKEVWLSLVKHALPDPVPHMEGSKRPSFILCEPLPTWCTAPLSVTSTMDSNNLTRVGTAASFITILGVIWTVRVILQISWSILFTIKEEHARLQKEVDQFAVVLNAVSIQLPTLSNAGFNSIRLRFVRISTDLLSIGSREVLVGYSLPSRLALLLASSQMKKLKGELQSLKDDFTAIVGVQHIGRNLIIGLKARNSKSSWKFCNEIVSCLARYQGQTAEDFAITPFYRETVVEAANPWPGSTPKDRTKLLEYKRGSFGTYLSHCDGLDLVPIGMLEASSAFFPESYASQPQVPDLVVTSHREEARTNFSSVDRYRVIYRQDSRTSLFVNLILDLPTSSCYWRFAITSDHRRPYRDVSAQGGMPMNLLRRLALALDSLQITRDDYQILLRAPDSTEQDLIITRIMLPSAAIAITPGTENTEQAVGNRIYHLGCRRFDENEVARIACLSLPDQYLASVDGCLVEEVVSLHRPPNATFCYNVQLLHLLRDEPGFACLKGVIVKSQAKHVKSYLLEWPATAFARILAASWSSHDKTALTLKEEFYKAPDTWEDSVWFGPNPLPHLPNTVPRWLQGIVDACCAGISARPSCGDLLAKFPSANIGTSTNSSQTQVPELQNQLDMRSCHYGVTCCSLCWKQITGTGYACNICKGGDFDMCLACFERGNHCDDPQHLLLETKFQGWSTSFVTHYHSSPDKLGKRKICALTPSYQCAPTNSTAENDRLPSRRSNRSMDKVNLQEVQPSYQHDRWALITPPASYHDMQG
ncbi:hypothetical protein EK21DRAFT_92182 [Setomelanomma holmii]|uniref:ZZ-type domain-containing protein n=1 Tax=Setomelanomma holmii TaxID=210430 RepID=A0A9P4LJI0_9PLEO|nr:hypothetical protein EK21DRAFT_92182 [Setomelanomma holmii]